MKFSDKLLDWFDLHGRKDLPWQIDKTPYRVWVSEIMLQQTQVNTVIDYYLRFMTSFPSVHDLANAHEDTVLEHWSGLGYYARARNLHKTAKIVADELKGYFPDTVDGLVQLPGIGRSTAGAITSIAHKKYAPILDGNVKRVLCRYYNIQTWPGERQTEKQLWELAEDLTPQERTDDYTQAIMDLGATLCSRSKPRCADCPMTSECQSFEHGTQTEIPKSKPKKEIPLKQTTVVLIEGKEGILLEKRPPSGIWGGLYSLPELDQGIDLEQARISAEQKFGCQYESTEAHAPFRHTFSHFKLELQPYVLKQINPALKVNEESCYRWINPSDLSSIGLPAPISKYLNSVYKPSLLNNK